MAKKMKRGSTPQIVLQDEKPSEHEALSEVFESLIPPMEPEDSLQTSKKETISNVEKKMLQLNIKNTEQKKEVSLKITPSHRQEEQDLEQVIELPQTKIQVKIQQNVSNLIYHKNRDLAEKNNGILIIGQSENVLSPISSNKNSSTNKNEIIDSISQLKALLLKYQIDDEQEVEECLKWFQQNNIKQLKKQPDRKFRSQFGIQLDALIERILNNSIKKEIEGEELNIEIQLRKILIECQVQTEEELQECIRLFEDKDFQNLIAYPDRKQRKKFAGLFDQLLKKIQETKAEFNPKKEFIELLKLAEIIDEEQIKECLDLYEQMNVKQLKKFPDRPFRKNFADSLDKLLIKIQKTGSQQRQSSLQVVEKNKYQSLLSNCQISSEDLQKLSEQIKEYNFSGLLKTPEEKRRLLINHFKEEKYNMQSHTMENQLRLSLCPYMTDSEIDKLIQMIGKRKKFKETLSQAVIDIVEEIEKEFQIEVVVMSMSGNNSKSIKFNEIVLQHDRFFLSTTIERIMDLQKKEMMIFHEKEQIKLQELVFSAKQFYHLEVYQLKLFNCIYKGKNMKISLLPQKSNTFNKGLILEELFKKELIYEDKEPFNTDAIKLKFEIVNRILSMEDYAKYDTLVQLQHQKGEIATIRIEVMMEVTLYYEDIMDTIPISSDTTVSMFKTIIDEKYVPLESQILALKIKGEIILIKEDIDDEYISRINPSFFLVFELSNKQSTQFYGFHKNYHLQFQSFSSCFIENSNQIESTINCCSFTRKDQREEENFLQQFFLSLYSGIKKRFPLQTILDKYKNLVSKLKYEDIWIPKSNCKGIKVNQSFVFAYILYNADQRLKIETMNLLKENLPIPLFLRPFENIFKVHEKMELNKELLWILPKAFTITSIGLHNENKIQQEKGKSNLLNQIFPTHFEQHENKQAIIQGIPFIAVRVFQNIFPLNVIDIPHDSPPEISDQIMKNSNIIMIHSWKSEQQTQSELERLKRLYHHIPFICLMRDSKEAISLKNFKEQRLIANEKIQKISNFWDKKRSSSEINLLKEEIFKFIKEKLLKNQQTTKIFKLFRENQIYIELTKTIEKLEKQYLHLTPIGDCMEKIKKETDDDKVSQLKDTIKTRLSPEIKEILLFLTSDKVKPLQSLALPLLREKIRTYQSEINIKLLKVYELRNQFLEIAQMTDSQEKLGKIQQLDQKLRVLEPLKPESIVRRTNTQIIKILTRMASCYENEVKPKIFSMELFWRELNYLISIDENALIDNKKLLDVMRQLKEIQIENNLPFEIIDGDLLQIPRKLMKELFEIREDRAIVLTIMGPQSSGKSTLLNFLFGCDFATSEGRCTRGVYGTFFKFSENRGQLSNFNNCEGIFVIDTEGLFAITNEEDKGNEDRRDFDSKLVLFCLAVSDIVVVNVRGNFDLNTEKIVRLCHERLEELNIEPEKRPQLAVVLNQNASSRQEESQNEFKEIKKSISFDISKSLSLAYKIVNYDHQQITLFERNQILTKKYPQEAFLNETTHLMNEILKKIAKKKEVSPLSEIVQKFERIWAMVVAFPNLSKSVTKQYIKLQTQIKQWVDTFQEEEKSELVKIYEDFRLNKTTQNKILEEIQNNHKKILHLFDQQFKEKFTDEEDIKFLRRQERSKIQSKSMVTTANIKYELQNIKLKKQIKLSAIEGDFMIKEKAREIFNDGKEHSEEQLQDIFNKTFEQQLDKIEMATNLGEEVIREYQSINKNYEFLIKTRTGSEKGLPKEKYWIGNDRCSVEEMLQMIKSKILQPHEERSENVLEYTNKIHTNILKGGKTDASLEYFNIKDYFYQEQIIEIYGLNTYDLGKLLNRAAIQSIIRKRSDQIKKVGIHYQKLKQIWDEINNSLGQIGLEFTKFDQFKSIFDVKNSFFSGLRTLWTNQSIQYKFLNQNHSNKDQGAHSQNYRKKKGKRKRNNNCNYNKSNVQHQDEEPCQCQFSKYLFKEVESSDYYRCLCSYSRQQSWSYLSKIFYSHINWNAIVVEIQKSKHYSTSRQKINEEITNIINNDLKAINIQVNSKVNIDWIELVKQSQIRSYNYSNSHYRQSNYEVEYDSGFRFISFQSVGYPIDVSSQEKFNNAILNNLSYLQTRNLKHKIIKKTSEDMKRSESFLPMFIIANRKLLPKQKNYYLDTYIKQNTDLTIRRLKDPKCRDFLFGEIKYSKKSLDKFFFNIFTIVQGVIDSWKVVTKKALSEIYNRVNQQISKFNNDLNQISYNISETYLGYVNLSVVYMIWKLIIDGKIKEKREIYETKMKEKDKEWQSFKARTSKDEDKNVQGDIRQFFKQFVILVNEEVNKKKEECMNLQKEVFTRENTRDEIQTLIDMNIFRKQTPEADVLYYLQTPYDVIMNKYQECYEMSWEDLEDKYSTERVAKDILREFYDMLGVLDHFLEENGIDNSKQTISELFKIADSDIKFENLSVTQDEYRQEGKKVLFQYFIDSLLSEDPNQIRKCAKVSIQPLYPFKIQTQTSITLRRILLEIKTIKYLSMTNLSKFVKKMMTAQLRSLFSEDLDKISQLNQKDNTKFINMIKVVICSQKCPCCGRICGIENEHEYHKCLYGHQMRGLNGTYIERDNDIKEASVIRCEQMAESDLIKYNGTEYTWIAFKDYWKGKSHGGWHFDDANLLNNPNQVRFQKMWTLAGPIYCANNNIKYVDFNNSQNQKTAVSGNIHYIFAVDQSGSMSGTPWSNLLTSLRQTIDKIKAKDNGKNNLKISIIKFASDATLYCENYLPDQINTNIPFRSGGTNFDPPFNMAATLAARYIQQSSVVFVCMTDGGASYPTQGIKVLKKLQSDHPKKLHYAGIEFGGKVRVMDDMATALQGKSNVAYSPDQLTDLFMKSIEVIEYREKN